MRKTDKKREREGQRMRSENQERSLLQGMIEANGVNGFLYQVYVALDRMAFLILQSEPSYEEELTARRYQRVAGKIMDVMHTDLEDVA